MENTWKRLLSILLALCMAISCLPVTVQAAEAVPEMAEDTVSPDIGLPGNEELFALYAEQVLYGYERSTLGTAAGDLLTGDEKLAYDALKPVIAQIASGQRSSTSISLGFGEYSVNVGGVIETWTPEITVNFTEAYADFDYASVTRALLSDCPFEMYWFDKTVVSHHMSLQTQQLCYFEFRFRVADAYSAGTLLTDTSKTGAAAIAAANANAVVAANAGKSDYERLVAYRNYICDAVSYNHAAADDDSTPYGDPWQLIYVFDGNSDTNVVCEGYAKAFQYLCDLDGNLACTRVSGYMQGATGAGNHMWNVVTLEGKNYLVDVTNSDDGTIGSDGSLFMAGSTYENGKYAFICNGVTVTFTCDDLNLAAQKYAVQEEPATYSVTITDAENGTVTAEPTTAKEGDTVTLTVTPADGFELESMNVKCGEADVTVTDNKFTMPGGDVAVSAVFKKHTHDYENGVCTVCGKDGGPYAGKMIACIGDSITAGVGVTKDETDYVTLLAQSLEMDYIRLGASGTTLCTDGHATCNVGKLTEENLAGADVVTVLMGINDFVQARSGYYTLGTVDSTDTSTIYGAVHMWCQRIEELRQKDSLKNTAFYFLTPVITSWNNSVSSARNWDQSKTNIHGYTLRDLCNAIIEVSALYDIPVIDLNLVSGLYYNSAEDNNIDKFGGDGAHPGTVGHQMMADAIKNRLLQNDLRDDHDHSYGSWITTTYPDCESGEQQRVCAVCTATESKKLDGKGHTYENGICTGCGEALPNLANYYGKVVSVLGDSISTFAGYIPTADGYNREHLARYPQDNLLTDVNETWWMQVIAELNAKLGINDSWRGSTLSGAVPVTTGDTGENAAMSNLIRIQNLGSNGTPDVILLYGGTNDLAHVSKVGTFDPATAPTEVDLSTTKWDNLADGFVHTLLRLRHFYPDALIVAMLPTYTASYYSDEKLAQGNAVMAEICEHYGIPYVDLRDSGVSADHLPDGIHPGEEGMDLITDAVLKLLEEKRVLESGESVVYPVTHELTYVKASLGHYKGISAGKSFVETLDGDNMTVTVTMDGVDITAECYANGKITIAAVTGALMITAEGDYSLNSHLQQLPDSYCGVNLWQVLEHDPEYYSADGWTTHSSGKVKSITFPVSSGDRLYASSFGAAGTNGGSTDGIRVTFFTENGLLVSMTADKVYSEFSQNGYLTVPGGATAVSIPMWTDSDDWDVHFLCLMEGHLQQIPDDAYNDTNLWRLMEHDAQYYSADGWATHSSGAVKSVSFPVNPGDQLYASSFGAAGINGGSIDGIRVTYFTQCDVLDSLSAAQVYAQFSEYGYLTVPEGAVSVNIPMWDDSDSSEVYVLTLPERETGVKNFTYTLDTAQKIVTLTQYTGAASDVAVHNWYWVDGIRYRTVLDSATVFRGNTGITFVRIENAVRFKDNSMAYLFSGCKNLTAIDMTGVDTSAVTDMECIFDYCSALTTIVGYESWDTGSVERMYKAFNRTTALKKVDLSSWDLDQVKNTGWCFQLAGAEEILLPDNLAVISAGFLNHATKVTGTTFTIPAGVKKIGYAHTIYDFATDDFVEFVVAQGNTNYKTVDGILYSMDCTELLAIPRNKPFENGIYEIPEGVTFMGELSFSRNYNIQKLILPDSYVVEQNVEVYDEDYIVFEDRGNLNNGNSLSIAIYCYTGITDYEVKDTNPNYTSVNGILYSKDMKQVIAIPTRYGRIIDIPEGVTTWNKQAMWDDKEVADQYDMGNVVDNLLGETGGVKIPASLVSIEEEQVGMINRLKTKYQDDFVITVDDANPVYCVDDAGMLQKKPQLPEVKWTANANLGSSLTLYLAFNIADLEDTTGCYAVLTRTYADETADDVITVHSDKWKTMTLEGVKYFYVSYSGLAAKEMTDEIRVQIFNAEGKAVSEVHTDSLRDFAMRKLTSYSTKNKNSTIYAQMLMYGAAAQNYFGYAVDDLADSQMTAEQKSFGVDDLSYKTENNAVIGQNYAASNLQLQSTIKLYLKFSNISNASYAKVTFTNHNQKVKEVTVPISDFKFSGTAVMIDSLVGADYNVEVTCTVYDSNDNVLAYATDSVENYIGRNYTKNALYGELLKYMMAAYRYFHS